MTQFRDKISKFFQPYLSGTHASLEQRLENITRVFRIRAIRTQIFGHYATINSIRRAAMGRFFDLNEFGARPRDYGYQPSGERFVKWRSAFIDVGANLATSSDSSLRFQARRLLGQ